MIKIITIGTRREKYLLSAIDEFVKRLSARRITYEQHPKVDEHKLLDLIAKEKQKNCIVVLEELGELVSSTGFAQLIKQKNHLTFIIGDAFGLPASVKKAADMQLSLSRCTFTHEFAFVLLLEQIYRGYCILENKPYHK